MKAITSITYPAFALFVLACFGLLPTGRAVVPKPDGGYPGSTTAEGTDALLNLATGVGNTALGWRSLFSDTTGSYNTGVGGGALILNNGDSNTGVGATALLLNTTGSNNTAVGTEALLFNDTGNFNTAIGAQALYSNTGVTASENTAIGFQALYSNTIGTQHTAVGYQALLSNVTGANNTAVGFRALQSTTASNLNTALGASALTDNTTGAANTATGAYALEKNDTGSTNTANGYDALQNNDAGDDNTALGYRALQLNTTGARNTAIGEAAGRNQDTGSDNVYIGSGMDGVAGESNACYIASIFGQTSASGTQVLINADNKLGTSTSSKRFKEDIKPMGKASEALYALEPVTFHYKKEIDPLHTSQLGLVAEDVDKVNPDLVVRDKEGKPYSVRYDQVNAMLLNEFLKEHRKVAQQGHKILEQDATIEQLKSGMATLTATVKEQAAQIQKVSAQLATDEAVRLADLK